MAGEPIQARCDLPQQEADRLLLVAKQRVDEKTRVFPCIGEAIQVELVSMDERDAFVLDVNRSGRIVLKATFQTRTLGTVIFARLGTLGGPHVNPDGETIPCPTCTSTGRDSATSGPSPSLWTSSAT